MIYAIPTDTRREIVKFWNQFYFVVYIYIKVYKVNQHVVKVIMQTTNIYMDAAYEP